MKAMSRQLAMAAIPVLALAGPSQASSIQWSQTGGGSTGMVSSFDGSSFAGSIGDAVTAAHNGSGVFAGAGFASDMINVFTVNLGGDAGLTLIALWGNSGSAGYGFEAHASISHSISAGSYDGTSGVNGVFGNPVATAGVSEAFAFGGAEYNVFLNEFAIGSSSPLATGFAITNIQNFDGLSDNTLQLGFLSLDGDIGEWGLFSADFDSPILTGGGGLTGSVVAVPLPAPVWMGLAGLAAMVVLRRKVL